MSFQGKAISLSSLENDIYELKFDLQGESVNKFNSLTLTEFAEVVGLLKSKQGVKGLIVTSGKELFIAGADITEFAVLFAGSEEDLKTGNLQMNQVFNDFEDLAFPKVCAINGVALGGGLEMALACEFRVMAATAKVGLPEVKLGINPGFGGTVRLPRVIGADNAIEMVCTGNEYRADKALAYGVVDAVVAPELVRDAALAMLNDAIAGDFDYVARQEEKRSPLKLNDIERMMVFTSAKGVVIPQAGPFPAPKAALKSMEKSANLDREAAIEVEASFFVDLAKTEISSALVQLFLNSQSVEKIAKSYKSSSAPVAKAAVLGAGIMGGGIAYQSAVKGTPVVMKDINDAGIQLGLDEAKNLLAKRVNRGRMSADKMGDVLNNIHPTLNYGNFEEIDIVVEAVVENENVKKAVLAECEQHINKDAVLASNTSTISITRLAEALERPENFCGMHFFNPVHAMPLVEVIRGEKSSEETIARTVAYAVKMGKTPVVVNDCPGFFVNRVLFPYFAGFNLMVAEGADYRQVDKVMEKFGWPMGPAYLLDVVGIDTADHAGSVMANAFPDRLQFESDKQSAVDVMFKAGRFGQKNDKGFYKYELDRRGKSKKVECVDAIELVKSVGGFTKEFEADEVIARVMVPMVNEVMRCMDEGIVATAAEADMALIMGIGFPMFRGGALKYVDSIGAKAFCEMADRFAHLGALYTPTDSLRQMAASGQSFYGAGE
ncbi:3-hydroxyacyl-CoA dehydrogenase/enoyl-CoA hydratase/3-hydroxybutyryl-CoA epimerase/enoyl-CoA isomerase [Sinobacterium caligoides]|uniref:enoyl-CoA hydratase n=1 Tax=Sinobacterium caligoides TaxID=933926 RepID=A0A3N2DJR7_9GAMM|nr:fatty acid oxidation complex subunit alpha FadB [Sinobacterium caligoides]ROS00028.1 3-hydroxyacyl-CoA dehydrogenase/enoyl-CoA hydratase/3-hydroxybutyryl-CoA epimerase/enoyl-CoA isomerase [Sinobacterium caligoides]